MKLYQNLSILPKLYKAIGENNEYYLHANIEQFKKPNFGGIDSLRFIITKSFFEKIKRELHDKFSLDFTQTSFNSRHYTLADIYSEQTPKQAYTCKISAKINAYAYHSTDTLNLCREVRLRLDERMYFEIHGLFQYDSKGDTPITLDKHTRRILSFLFKYADYSKTRHNIRLKSFDYALDYAEQGEINQDYIYQTAPYLQNLSSAKVQRYQGTSTHYIQTDKRPNAQAINEILQRVRFYDKKAKNELQSPKIRAELCFLIADND